MKLTLLGTGPSAPIPRMYCNCHVCEDARKPGSYSRRTRSSALLFANGKHILFDAGPDVLYQLERAKTHCVDAVFFTNAHNDAAGGFFDLEDLVKKQNHQTTLYVEPRTWKRISRNLDHTDVWFKVKMIQPGKTLKIYGTPITPFRVVHSATPNFPTLGYRIADKLVYASDVKSVPEASERFIVGANHAVLDGCFWFNTHFPTHLTADETIALANRLKVRHLYLTQISHNYPPYNEATRKIEEYCKKQNCTTSVQLAFDGMKIEF